ncbi:MAG: response regulator [Deltaproteobacteria bacterium]|nr:response regulator [Deltaproteobacteria bacterium]
MTKILIVDDEGPIRELLGQILEGSGYDCTLAANAAHARECLKEQDFDLIVSDIRMPGESGLDLIRYALAEHPDTAALMVSALDDFSTAETALEIGVYGYIIKPFDSKGVLISVSNALRRRQLEIDNRAYRENLEQIVQERTAALKKNKEELEHTLSKLKQTQAQMIQSEKMASIGQLAAGVAHEINNPTGFIGSNLNTLLDYHRDIGKLIKQYRQLVTDLKDIVTREQDWAAISEQLEGIVALEAEADIDFILDDVPNLIGESQDGTERLKRIVADLKDFAHPGKDKLESADINKSIDSTLNVVWNELKYKATVTKEYGDLPLVECYPHQLNQVFMNLLVNAAQAIEEKGEIKIATQALDGQVEINISDTGSGIPKENLSRIFDAFFTTKEIGKGTGLGLNVAYNIIQKHKGTIDVESEMGKGTTFRIRLQIQPDLVEYSNG